MSNTKFTPGPWDWFANHKGEVVLATPDRGRLYVMDFGRKGMQGATPRFSRWDGENRERQGGIMLDAADYLSESGSIYHPDAHLIAAAPDMYDALKVAEKILGYVVEEYPGHAEQLRHVKDALKKARGE